MHVVCVCGKAFTIKYYVSIKGPCSNYVRRKGRGISVELLRALTHGGGDSDFLEVFKKSHIFEKCKRNLSFGNVLFTKL